MYIKSLQIKNFRNYSAQSFKPVAGLNVVYGKNAAGKTNLLESLYCCAVGKSPRTSKYKELIKWDADYAYVSMDVAKKYRDYRIEIYIDSKEKKRIAVDGVGISRMGELMGVFNAVYFSPDEMKLVKSDPKERRRFMDLSLSQQSKPYFYTLSRYNNVLEQRNKLLKTIASPQKLKEALYVWDVQLAKEGAAIVRARRNFISRLKGFAAEIHATLTDGEERLELDYETQSAAEEKEETERDLLRLLNENFEKDAKLTFTSVGPHRDDIFIASDGVDVRKFGSQGQQRTVSLSLKLAEIKLFEAEVGETPVLLLDDVLSELDEGRRRKLMEMSAGMQTVITCTDFDMDVPHASFEVENGKIKTE